MIRSCPGGVGTITNRALTVLLGPLHPAKPHARTTNVCAPGVSAGIGVRYSVGAVGSGVATIAVHDPPSIEISYPDVSTPS